MNKIFFMLLSILLIAVKYGGQAQDHQNDWYYNPFNQYSAHHRAIGTGAIYADEDHPAVQDWLKGSRIAMNVGDKPHGLFMIDADEDGPVLTVNKRQEWGTSGLPVDMRFPSGGVNIDFPDHFDGNMTVYDRTIDVFNHLRVYAWNDGNPVAMQHRAYRPDIVGHGSKLMERTGTSASGVAAPFGILRGWEVEKEGHPIGHALQLSLPGQSGYSAMMLGREVWWPAVSMDGWVLRDSTNNTGNIPYGSLWAIPPEDKGGPDLTTLGLTEKGMRLAEAIRDYGMYVVDNSAGPAIRCDQNFHWEVRAELVDATRKFYKYIRLVVNSVPEEGKVKFNVGDANQVSPTGGEYTQIIPGEFPAGGGEPLAPNTAIDAVTSSEKVVYPNEGLFESLQVFPNPAKDRITVRFDNIPYDGVEVDITNMLGQVVVRSQKMTEPVITIRLPDEQSIYFVRVTSNNKSKMIKVIKL